MSTLQIPVSDSLKEFLEEQAAKAGYQNVSEFVQALLEEEQHRQSREYIESDLLRGLDSGASVEADAAFWERFALDIDSGWDGERGIEAAIHE